MATPWSEDIHLLLHLLRQDREGVQRCIRSRDAPLDSLVALAAANRLSLIVLDALAESPIQGALSADSLAVLEQLADRQRGRSAVLLEELEKLVARLTAAGQPFLLLKGPYLAARFYGDLHRREYVDLDLLVPVSERDRVVDLLVGAGYKRKSRLILGPALTGYFVHGFDFTNGRAKVDLHWTLSRHPSFRLDEAGLWARRQSYVVNGRSFDVLADEHELLFAVLSALRDLERSRWKLKSLIDLLRMVDVFDATFDWDAFLETRRGERTLGPTVNVLGLALDVANAPELFPRLRAALARHATRRVPFRFAAKPFTFAPARFGIGNKLWSARAHDTSFPSWFVWWATSLPFRTAVHRPRRRRPAPDR